MCNSIIGIFKIFTWKRQIGAIIGTQLEYALEIKTSIRGMTLPGCVDQRHAHARRLLGLVLLGAARVAGGAARAVGERRGRRHLVLAVAALGPRSAHAVSRVGGVAHLELEPQTIPRTFVLCKIH